MLRTTLVAFVLLGTLLAPRAECGAADDATSVDPLNRVPFVYEIRGRDIFTYRQPSASRGAADLIDDDVIFTVDDSEVPIGPEPGDDDPTDISAEERKKAEAAKWVKYAKDKAAEKYNVSERLFAEQDFAGALKLCEVAINNLDQVNADAPDLYERLVRMRKASEGLKLRTEVEKEFAELTIGINSIVFKEHSPAAVINGLVLKEGQFVADTNAQVLQIERGYVVFLYRGYKVRKRMG